MSNSYTFNTELTGFVAVEKDQGKFNKRESGYLIPEEISEQIISNRVDLLMWAKSETKADAAGKYLGFCGHNRVLI